MGFFTVCVTESTERSFFQNLANRVVIMFKKFEGLVYQMLTDSLKTIVWPPSRNSLSMELKTTIVGGPLTGEE